MLWTIVIGGGLLVSGFALGYLKGLTTGTQDVMNELMSSGLLTPEKVLSHYAKEGNEKARDLMHTLDRLKREKANKEKADD